MRRRAAFIVFSLRVVRDSDTTEKRDDGCRSGVRFRARFPEPTVPVASCAGGGFCGRPSTKNKLLLFSIKAINHSPQLAALRRNKEQQATASTLVRGRASRLQGPNLAIVQECPMASQSVARRSSGQMPTNRPSILPDTDGRHRTIDPKESI